MVKKYKLKGYAVFNCTHCGKALDPKAVGYPCPDCGAYEFSIQTVYPEIDSRRPFDQDNRQHGKL